MPDVRSWRTIFRIALRNSGRGCQYSLRGIMASSSHRSAEMGVGMTDGSPFRGAYVHGLKIRWAYELLIFKGKHHLAPYNWNWQDSW